MILTNFIDHKFLTERKEIMKQPPSSRMANDKMNETGTKLKHADIIYNAILESPNRMATATNVAIVTRLDYVSVNRRLSELVTAKRIEIFSEKGGRTATNNPCRIYQALVASSQAIETVTEQQTLFS